MDLVLLAIGILLLGATLTVTYNSTLSVKRVYSGGNASAADNSLTIDGLKTTASLGVASSPPPAVDAAGTATLSGGALTLDLRALADEDTGTVVDGNGLKVQMYKFKAAAGNANPITITAGASNGYELFGASGSLTLHPGDEVLVKCTETKPDIDATHKTLDLAGTGSQTLDYHLVMG